MPRMLSPSNRSFGSFSTVCTILAAAVFLCGFVPSAYGQCTLNGSPHTCVLTGPVTVTTYSDSSASNITTTTGAVTNNGTMTINGGIELIGATSLTGPGTLTLNGEPIEGNVIPVEKLADENHVVVELG